ncbi:DNA-directed RNA polymerase subunit beta' [Trichinella pseudospiralis]
MDFIGRRGNVDVILPSSMKQNVSDVSAENYCSLICELVDKSDDGIDGTALKSNSVVISPLLSVQFGRHHLVQFTIVLQDFNADE